MNGAKQRGRDSATEWRGGAFYDAPDMFDRYREHRQWPLNPNAVMEEPALQAELGPVAGLRVLDLGCGDAAAGRDLLNAGCARYIGVDGSEKMVEAARAMLQGTRGEVVHGNIEDFSASPASFELVLSRMALHYVANLPSVLRACHDWLVPGGRLLFTVVHPVITSNDPRTSSTERRGSWVVDGYFLEGPREQPWLGGTTVWQHRTIERYVSELRDAGFDLTGLRECPPERERFADDAEFERRCRIPLVLLLAAARRESPD
jgi:SAM-dependent methyltransferase